MAVVDICHPSFRRGLPSLLTLLHFGRNPLLGVELVEHAAFFILWEHMGTWLRLKRSVQDFESYKDRGESSESFHGCVWLSGAH